MKYNAKYDRWFSEEGLVYRYDEKNDRLVLCSLLKTGNGDKGYLSFKSLNKLHSVHRVIWETFKGEIPEKMCIDHKDTDTYNNRLDNLKVVTYKENTHNPITLQRIRDVLNKRNKPTSEFGKKFREHYNMGRKCKLYCTEYKWYKKHGHCRWEEE